MLSLTKLIAPIKENYGIDNYPFMQKMCEESMQDKSYKGLSLLHNAPLYLNTLLKIEPLILGGAKLIVTNPTNIGYDQKAIDILRQAGIRVEMNHEKIKGSFDYVLDTSGDFKDHLSSVCGAVELTKSGEIVYGSDPKVSYPVINIDNSRVKTLETELGTGDGFVRAMQYFVGKVFYQQPFILFGYGKVAKGIALRLSQYTDQIIVIEKCAKACERAAQDGFVVLNASETKHVASAMRYAYAVVTATGVKNVITDAYDPNLFKGKLLVNMGAQDEYGPAFSPSEVLNQKIAANFALQEPTALKFIDPIFYVHNYAVNLMCEHHYSPGVHVIPAKLDDDIMRLWMKYHSR